MQYLVNSIIPNINVNETRTIFEGSEFSLKQYGGDDFVTFMDIFFNNYSRIHKPIGTLTHDLKFEEEQDENYLLQPNAVCLVIERNGEPAFTQMVAKRDSRPIHTDKLFGLDYESFYNNEISTGNTLYFFGKGSINLSLFSDEERKTIISELQTVLYYLIFFIARKDNCKNVYSYINRLMARSMQKQNISYQKITPYTILRGIDYVGVSYTGPDLDSLMDNCDFEMLVQKYF
nr:hypothetical protein [uncultured Pedobacter sp.]